MPDEPRTIQPVRFLNDPRIPPEGLKDFTPKYTPMDVEGQAFSNESPQSSVYGGQRRPVQGQPVVMDDKHLPDKPAQLNGGEISQGSGPEPAQEQGQNKTDKTTQTSQPINPAASRTQDQASGAEAPREQDDSRAEGNGPPKRKKQKPKQGE